MSPFRWDSVLLLGHTFPLLDLLLILSDVLFSLVFSGPSLLPCYVPHFVFGLVLMITLILDNITSIVTQEDALLIAL